MSRLSFFVASQYQERSNSLKKLLKPYRGCPKDKIISRRLGYVLVLDGFLNPILIVNCKINYEHLSEAVVVASEIPVEISKFKGKA